MLRRRDLEEFGSAFESHLSAFQSGMAAGPWETDLQLWDLLGMFLEDGVYKFAKGKVIVPGDIDYEHRDTTECDRDGCFRVEITKGHPTFQAEGALLQLVMRFTMIEPKLLGIDVARDWRTAYIDLADIPDWTVNMRRP